MGVKIAPDARRQFVNASGVPYSGAKLFYYAAGSTTKQTTYTTSTGGTPNSNPIVLDSAGRTPYGVWFTEGLTYKEVLAPSTDTDPPTSPIFTEDNLSGINDTSVSVSQWEASQLTPTYLSTTSFSVPGDQTSSLHVGRRLQLSVTAGTVYGRVSATVYGALTTVTVVMDSGQTLDSGLSSVNWSILTATDHAIPKLTSVQLAALGIADTASYAPLASPTFTGTVTIPTLDLTTALAIADGGTGQVTAAAAFNAIKQAATASASGAVELATDAEGLGGLDTTRAVTSANLASVKLYSANGYQKFPGGLILQWGNATASVAGTAVSFPVTFASAAYSVTIGQQNNANEHSIGSVTTSGFTFFAGATTNNNYWMAVGV